VLAFGLTDLPAQSTDTLETVKLDTFTVNSSADVGYGARFSTGASRINMDNLSVSASVITINKTFIDDLKPTEMIDVLKYVSGVNANGNPLNSAAATLRGYETSIDFRDGIPETILAFDGGAQFDGFAMERFEVIKGPAGVLFGATTVGGVFNRVSKMPLAQSRSMVRVTVGSNEYKRAEVDSGGPLNASGTLSYRGGLLYQDAESFLGGKYNRRGVFGVTKWAPNSDSSLWFRVEAQNDQAPIALTSWFMNDKSEVSTFLDRKITAEDPAWAANRYKTTLLEFGATHKIGPDVATRLVARYGFQDGRIDAIIKNAINFYDKNGVFLGREIAVGATPSVSFADPERFGSIQVTRQRRHDWGGYSQGSVNYDVNAHFGTGPMEHKAFLYSGVSSNVTNFNRFLWGYGTFDYLHPVYYVDPATKSTGGSQTQATTTNTKAFNLGAQDNISFFNERLVAAAGARYDWVNSTTVDPILKTNTEARYQDWTFKYGLIGKVRPGVALFTQHSETFQFVPGVNTTTKLPFKNLSGRNLEGGAKLDLFDGKVLATVSWFNAQLRNQVVSGDTLPDGTREQIQIGVNNTKGWEMDGVWQVTPAISWLVAYGDLTSFNATGQRIRAVPQGPNYKSFMKYSFLNGPLKSLEVGVGYVFVNKRAGDAVDGFTVPAYHTWDLMANYTWKRLGFSFVVRNLTDETYISTGGSQRRAQVGAFRTMQFSSTLRF
jgi:iron complex outermembrane receptor protein